ncbi:MAG TPA: hotdog domain-containing protein [Polyangia bacterium]
MLRKMNLTTEVIVGAAVDIRHRAPVPPGKQLWLRGRTSHLSERKATFAVEAADDDEIVCEGVMTFVATSREGIETRLARKLSTGSRTYGGAPKRQQRSVVSQFDDEFHSSREGRHGALQLLKTSLDRHSPGCAGYGAGS